MDNTNDDLELKDDNTNENTNRSHKRQYDIIIYGATGFTGQWVAKYLCKRELTSKSNIRWAIAGRSKTKLEKLKKDILLINPKLNNLKIFISDVTKEDTLDVVTKSTFLLISCVGPFRFYGEYVVQNCVKNGCHYLDICGEPEFIENMVLNYYNKALKNNTIIISACGFDSIPSDIGQQYITQWFEKNNGICSGIECFVTGQLKKGYSGHITTFESAVHGFSNVDKLNKIRKLLKENKDIRSDRKSIKRVGKPIKVNKSTYFFDKKIQKYSILFPFADPSVVSNSQCILNNLLISQMSNNDKYNIKNISFPSFSCYLSFNTYSQLLQAMAIGGLGQVLVYFEWGRKLLLKYPEWLTWDTFSHKGPTDEQINNAFFTSHFFGYGYSQDICNKYKFNGVVNIPDDVSYDIKCHGTVSGPDPGYKGTSMIIVETAICLLEEIDNINKGDLDNNIPSIKGGVFTPSCVFGNTNLVQRLDDAGINFQVKPITGIKVDIKTNNDNNNKNTSEDDNSNSEEFQIVSNTGDVISTTTTTRDDNNNNDEDDDENKLLIEDDGLNDLHNAPNDNQDDKEEEEEEENVLVMQN